MEVPIESVKFGIKMEFGVKKKEKRRRGGAWSAPPENENERSRCLLSF
jgi:hypothetical protein